jgi:Na+/serine symporter
MDEDENSNWILVITTCCLAGVALIFLLARVSRQVVKHFDVRRDGFTLIASWVSPSSISVYFDRASGC